MLSESEELELLELEEEEHKNKVKNRAYPIRVLKESIPAVANFGIDTLASIPAGLAGIAGGIAGGGMDAAHGTFEAAQENLREFLPRAGRGNPQVEAAESTLGDMIEKATGYIGDVAGDPMPMAMTPTPPEMESPAARTLGEAASNFLPFERAFHAKLGRGISPEQRAYIEKLEADRKAKSAPPPQEILPGQMELPLGERDLPYGMMERAQERVADDAALRQRQPIPIDPQGDLFKPDSPDLYPGNERSRLLQQEREGIAPNQDALLDPNLTSLVSKDKMEPFRQGDLDFPLRQEAWERDPYVETLSQEYQKWSKLSDAEKGAEVTRLAQEYAKDSYNMTTPDKYTGSMWNDKPTALGIEKTPVYPVGEMGPGPARGFQSKGIERTPVHPLDRPIGRKQAGAIDLTGIATGLKKFDDLPENLKLYAIRVAEQKADRKLKESGGMDENGRIVSREAENEKNKYIKESLDNSHFIKQVLASSSSGFDRKTLSSFGTKGKIGRQEGSINIHRDPEFRKFRDQLPEAMRGNARAMYKELKKMQEPPKALVNHEDPALRVINDIPGLKSWKDEISLGERTPEELKPDILKEKDLDDSWSSRAGRQLISGGKLLGYGTQNTVVRYVVQNVDRALREASRGIDHLILNDKTGFKPKWEKLPKDEMAEAWATLITHEGKTELTRDQLIDLHLSDRQIDAMMALRDADNHVHAMLNEARAAVGKPPIEKRLGHLPSRFRGDFLVRARDAEGHLIHMLGANTKFGAEAIKKQMQEKFPELKFDNVTHESMHRFKDASDVQMGYQMLVDALSADDPKVKALEDAYGEYMKKQGYDMLAFKRHFKNKVGVEGFEGGKVWEDGLTNAQEGLRSIMNYMDHAMKWAEMNKNVPNVKAILKDKDIAAAQPVATGWARAYMDQAMGRSTDMARTIDKLADFVANQTGFGQSLMVKGIRDTKMFVTAMYLGFLNVGFSISQMAQVMQTIPAWMHMMKNKGAEASLMKSYFDGAIDGVKGYAGGRESMTVLGREAWEYAKEYGIVEPKILEDVKTLADKDMNKWLKTIATGNMTYFERMARTMAYMSWVHFLHASGEFKMGRSLYEAASSMTDMTMVDYRQHERPMIYKQMGIFGEAANALTTFKHNYYSQAYALGKHRKGIEDKSGQRGPAGGYGPIATYVGLLAVMAGMVGMPGREDLDGLIRMWNKFGNVYVPTTREAMLEYLPDSVTFGPLSALSGMDISSKFSAANAIPDDWFSAFMPFAGTVGDVAKEGMEFAMNPNMTSGMQAINKASPNSLKWASEEYFKTKGVYNDPQTLDGTIKRTPFDQTARIMGLRSLDETRAKQNIRNVKDKDDFYEQRRASLLKNAKEYVYANGYDKEKLTRVVRSYVEAEGDANTFLHSLVGSTKAQNIEEINRMLIEAKGNARRAKRVNEAR